MKTQSILMVPVKLHQMFKLTLFAMEPHTDLPGVVEAARGVRYDLRDGVGHPGRAPDGRGEPAMKRSGMGCSS